MADGPAAGLRPLAPAMRRLLLVASALVLAVGSSLFLLTALTGRAIGAWLLGLSVAAGQLAWENDAWRTAVGWLSDVALGGLALLALARYPGELEWSGRSAWLYLGFLVSFLAVGGYGWWAAGRQPEP